MTTRQQYKRAYELLRSQQWDFTTFRIVAEGLGIDRPARVAALRSYSQSRWIDEIGEGYRNLSQDFDKIRREVTLGHY